MRTRMSTASPLRQTRGAKKGRRRKSGIRRFFRVLGIGIAVAFILGVLSLAAILIAPDKTLGTVVRVASDGPAPNSDEILSGKMPEMSTMYDGDGNVLANFYDQRRTEVKSYEMSQNIRNAVVSIEDRRFYEHEGVDWKGIFRALTVNLRSGQVEEGASTLTQQYVKNYTTVITATNEEEAAAATEQTVARKLTEITTAMSISDQISREEILTRYLNLVFFGHGAYGVEEAAWTYFNVPSSELNVPQSALLAGMVQGPSLFDPWQNPEGALNRRDDVIAAMLSTGAINQQEADAAWAAPLGVLPSPNQRDNGCIGAGNRGFFCDYAVEYLASTGIDQRAINTAGLSITTSLDPRVQQIADDNVKKYVNPATEGVAGVMSIIKPGQESHEVRAISSSRDYGFADHQTVLPLPTTNLGTGAGSVFKVFTAVAALENGVGSGATLRVPPTYESTSLGAGHQPGCNPNHYCVSNVGAFPATMTFRDVMAQSPNTPFVMLAESIGNDKIVDAAVRLGMRSYNRGDNKIADQMRGSGSFTLGPTPVSSIEMSNVAATLASGGKWCPASPIREVKNHRGEDVSVKHEQCEQVVSTEVASAMNYLLGGDHVNGTASKAAQRQNWHSDMAGKTGTTDNNQSASFFGYVDQLAASTYIFNDRGQTQALCTNPVRQCGEKGNLFGGTEPADMWFNTMNVIFGDSSRTTLGAQQQTQTQEQTPAQRQAPQGGGAQNSQSQQSRGGGEVATPQQGAGGATNQGSNRGGGFSSYAQSTVDVPGVGEVIVPNGMTPEEVLGLFGY